jgi:hypothetical protein
VRPYEVSLVGRWAETGPANAPSRLAAPPTPLAGRSVQVAIDDATGSRHTWLPSVQPGRRYVIGKGEGCDIIVDGVYASRRHCEIWLDKGAWWVSDAGSTNGVRVELGDQVVDAASARPAGRDRRPSSKWPAGARVVLSARADETPPIIRVWDRRRTWPGRALHPDRGGGRLARHAVDADRHDASKPERLDNHGADGLGGAHDRAAPERPAVQRGPIASTGTGDRLGTRRRIRPPP